jgi:hypothetical protein
MQIVIAIMFVTIGYVVCIAQHCLLLSCYKHDASFLSDLAQDASRIVLKCQSLSLCSSSVVVSGTIQASVFV